MESNDAPIPGQGTAGSAHSRDAGADAATAAGAIRHYLDANQDRLWKSLYVYVVKFKLAGAGTPAREAAFDLLGDLYAAALGEAASRYDPSRSMGAWLRGIGLNLVRRHLEKAVRQREREVVLTDLRRAGREGEPDERSEDELLAVVNRFAPGPERAVLGDAAAEALLERVSPNDREILRLVVLQNCDWDEAGRRLNVKPAAARLRYYRALERLRAAVAGDRGKEYHA